MAAVAGPAAQASSFPFGVGVTFRRQQVKLAPHLQLYTNHINDICLEQRLHPTSLVMPPQSFFLVSLPTSISPSDNRDEALTALRSAVNPDQGTTYPFPIPSFKIGTLDALVQQADELTKLEQGCRGVVDKIADSLRSILAGDEEKLQEQKVVNDSRRIPYTNTPILRVLNE